MKFGIFDHTGKSHYLRQRLLELGHQGADGPEDMDILLIDCDWPWAHPRPDLIRAAVDQGAIVAQYPHGGWFTSFVYDGLCDPDPNITLRLEHAPGHIQALAGIRDDLNQQAHGWLYCPTRPFEPVNDPKRILFGPRHPNMEILHTGSNGHDPGPHINQRIYRDLVEWDADIVVSLIGPPWRNGVWQHPNARFAHNPNMQFPHTFEQILSADVVIATGTIAAAAVALGKPTVMFDQDNLSDYIGGHYVEATHADTYRPSLRWPLDVTDGDLDELVYAACAGSPEQDAWRNTWVGEDGTHDAIEALEQAVRAVRPDTGSQSVVIAGATARAQGR